MADAKSWFKRIMIGLGILILVLFIRSINALGLYSLLQIITLQKILGLLVLALFIVFINVLIKAYRWKLLVHKVSGKETSLWFAFNSILVGVAASSFIPGRVELAKPILLKAEHNVPLAQSFSALIIERVLDLLTLLLIPAIALLLFPAQSFIRIEFIIAFVLLIVILAALIIFFSQLFLNITKFILRALFLPEQWRLKILAFAQEILQGFSIFKSKKTILVILFISLIANGLEIVRFFIIASALGINLTFGIASLIFISSLLIGIISFIPGGIGATELSAGVLLAQVLPNTNPELLKSAVLFDRIVSFYLLVLIGSILLMLYKKAFKKDSQFSKSQTF